MRQKSFVIQCLVFSFIVFGLLFNCSSERESFITDNSDQADLAKQSTSSSKSEEKPEFVEFDIAPKPVGGYGSISKHLVYPETARKDGSEGRVLVWLKIDAEGHIVKTQIKDSLSESFDRAAIEALEKTTWNPAMKDNEAIESWVAVPIEFRLK